MNVSRLPAGRKSRRWFFTILLAALFLPAVRTAWADDDSAREPEIAAAARSWLAEIDAGKYEQSYDQGCTALHNKTSKVEWVTVLTAIRPEIFGKLLHRSESSFSYKPDGFEGMDGECAVLIYNASFSKIGDVMEVVVLKREDGQWRGAGYNAQPQQTGA
jgi:hypothetical protein